MSEHFIILGLPRSMTAWVSCFLTCGDVFCQHELEGRMYFDEFTGSIREQPFPVSGTYPELSPIRAVIKKQREFTQANFNARS